MDIQSQEGKEKEKKGSGELKGVKERKNKCNERTKGGRKEGEED